MRVLLDAVDSIQCIRSRLVAKIRSFLGANQNRALDVPSVLLDSVHRLSKQYCDAAFTTYGINKVARNTDSTDSGVVTLNYEQRTNGLSLKQPFDLFEPGSLVKEEDLGDL